MKQLLFIFKVVLKTLPVLLIQSVSAQGYGGPLTFQGLDHPMDHSAVERAMGGVAIGANDIGLMFENSAALLSIKKLQVSIGGLHVSKKVKQDQHYAPVRYYSNLSLLLEGLTDQIPDPDPTLPGFTAQDTVQRPYDEISPNWSRSADRTRPLQVMLAIPVSFSGIELVAGAGMVQYADLDHYYQNNNVLSPSILSQRPLPTLRPTDDNPVEVDWMQAVRSREGSMKGYGVALAGRIGKAVCLGFSGMMLRGSSDDAEREIARGRLTFYSNAFRLDSVYSRIITTGTSEFRGNEFTLSGMVNGPHVRVGLSVKLPMTITRNSTARIETDTTGTPSISTRQSRDQLKLPLRGTIGLSLIPHDNLTLGLEYEIRPYKSVQVVDPDGAATSPWLPSSLFRIGVEHRPTGWLSLRGGMRGEAEVFEPEGNPIQGEPVGFTSYSAGFGLFFYGLSLNVAYEYALIKYQDVWASAISENQERRQTVALQMTYEIP